MKPPLVIPELRPALQIINPPQGATGPLPYPISDPKGCAIFASGRVADSHATQITAVRGWVNDSAFAQNGTWSGMKWQIQSVGKAATGVVNTFTVEVTYKKDDASVTNESASRDFIATGYAGSCSPMKLGARERTPLARIMPRYHKVTINLSSLPPFLRGEPLLLGGLLARTSVYLAYDVALSLPTEPVWRDINLPSSAGHWTLRIRATGGQAAGELVLQRLSETEVFPPLVFRCRPWNWTGGNLLTMDPHASAEGLGLAQITLKVEPA